ncbi:MAG TPA: hypothetical protein VND87_00595 [Stellaceae bacterium]|nr:hypothetical protein [Stellaceae bacterium]
MTAFGVIRATVRESRRGWLLMIVGFVVLYYATQLETVTIRLGHFPNYVTFYNYPANVWRIIRHTPAIADMVPLIGNEWLFETGYMNYDYGHGIAEWSLELIPANLIMVILIGVLVATCVLLLRRSRSCCAVPVRGAGAAAVGLGTVIAGAANVTMTWVTCCAAPSWVVGLTLLGLGTETAYAILPYGQELSWAGTGMLLATTYLLARRCAATPRERALAPGAAVVAAQR